MSKNMEGILPTTYTCCHCNKESNLCVGHLSDDITDGLTQIELGCFHCNTIETFEISFAMKSKGECQYPVTFQMIKNLFEPMSQEEVFKDWVICRYEQIKFDDDVDEYLRDLIKRYLVAKDGLGEEHNDGWLHCLEVERITE